MRSLVRWSILVACLLLVQASVIPAATPQAVQVQVRLQDAVGNPVPDGLHSLILTGWDDSTGGILLWTQNQMVTTQQGLTQCFIESPAASAILAHSGQQYIQVQVAGEAPLLPRIRLGSVPSALLTTRMDGDIVTRPGEMHITNPGSGDPDFDLLRITADPTGSSLGMSGGDPDFDLLRVSAAATTGSITVGSGDPDFDLLRITGSPAASSVVLNPGSGDPDFDLLRVTADATGSSMAMNSITGDPDFDLLRITATDSTGKIAMSHGDPDFDLLRITGSPAGSSMTLNGSGDPDFDLLRVSAAATTGSITVGSGDPDFDLLRITGSPAASSIVLNPGSGDPDFDLLRIVADNSGGSIAIDEEGVQRVKASGGNGAATLSLNGLPPGTPVGGLITMEADSTGGGIAIDEEGVQRLREFVNNGGVVIVLDGHSPSSMEGGKITTSVDSTGSSMTSEFNGVPGARLTVKGSKRTYNFFESWPCGMRDVEIGTQGMTMSCTPGGSTTPDTAVQIDPAGDMTLAGDLSVGGDICAVGTIGACSDARYKTDVEALQGALATIGRMRGVNFNWRTDEFPEKGFRTDRDFGFIAQELKEVIPQVVTLGKDGYYSVDYGRITPLLVEAVKELEARLASVEAARQAEVSALNDRLAQLEAQFAKLAAGGPETDSDVKLADAK